MKKEWGRKSEQWILWLSILLILTLSGCGGTIGTKDVGFRKAYEQINANALLDEEYSATSKNVLQRYNMGEFFRENPLKCLNELHKKIKIDHRRDLLFSLAELNYFTAKYTLRGLDDSPLPENGKYYLNAAIYGYFYLFDKTRNKPAGPFDRRFRLACDIYNIALAKAMTNPKGNLVFEAGTRQLPFGTIDLSLNARNFPVKLDQVSKLSLPTGWISTASAAGIGMPDWASPLLPWAKKSKNCRSNAAPPEPCSCGSKAIFKVWRVDLSRAAWNCTRLSTGPGWKLKGNPFPLKVT